MNLPTFFTDPVFILCVGIVIVVGGIIGCKLHPFLALLLGAFVVAIMTPAAAIEQQALTKGAGAAAALQLSTKSVGERVATEFGNTCAKVGILIAMAAIIGKCMLESGAAERIVRSVLHLTGMRKAPAAFIASSFFLGIPVFFDAVILLMMPLAKAMSVRNSKNYLLFVLAIAGGAAMANSLVPPAPGPLFLAGEMQIPIGMMITGGIMLGLITITAGYFFARWVNRKWPVPLRDSPDARLEDIQSASMEAAAQLPPLWLSLLPVAIPLVFICAGTALRSWNDSGESTFTGIVNFLSDKNMALTLGGFMALIMLAVQKKRNKININASLQGALQSGGSIILIIAAGGAFGGMLQQTGISMRIAQMTEGYQVALIPLAFFITAIVRTAQGSATVALITTSGILSGMTQNAGLAFHPLYIGLAIGCGSKLIWWMNDSGFWVTCKMSNLTEREMLRSSTMMLLIMGCTGLIAILIAAMLFPLK